MSRAQVRIVLILIAFILVIAAVLFGILTYWVGAEGLPTFTPEPGATGRFPLGSWRFVALDLPWLRIAFAVDSGDPGQGAQRWAEF